MALPSHCQPELRSTSDSVQLRAGNSTGQVHLERTYWVATLGGRLAAVGHLPEVVNFDQTNDCWLGKFSDHGRRLERSVSLKWVIRS
jgi:hypothetical protein